MGQSKVLVYFPRRDEKHMTRHVLKTDPKFLRRQFEKAVGKSIPKILTELITNSDDSYKRMERENSPRMTGDDYGTIRIIVDYGRKIVKVIDQAQGLVKAEMENKFVVYGKESDDQKSGVQTRSLFGKGLRDVLFTQKVGVVKSIKNEVSCISKFYWDYLKKEGIEQPIVEIRDGPRMDKDLRLSWGIQQNGTTVEFRLRDDVRMPQHDKLLEKMNNFYMLRKINSNPKRKVTLTSYGHSKMKNHDLLHYNFPFGEVVERKKLVLEYDGKQFPVDLELSKSKGSLVQAGYGYEEREGGLLLIDEEDNVLDLTLFTFDTDPSASRLYGVIRIIGSGAFIKGKLSASPPEVILSEEREGLVRNHPFYRALARLVDPILEPIVKEERKQDTSRGQFSPETQGKHKDGMDLLNRMYEQLVGKPETGDGLHGKKPFVPDFVSFIRPQVTITYQTETPVALLVNCKTVSDGTEITITSQNSKITASPEKFNLDHSHAKEDLFTKVLHVVGYESGIVGKISAKAVDHSASMVVSVIDKEVFYPKNGIEFNPSNVKLRDSIKKSLHLYIDAEKIPVGAYIHFSCGSPSFSISADKVQFKDEMKIAPEIGHLTIEIVGHGIGQECVVEASVNSFTAAATVLVASKRETNIKEQGGKFKPPEFIPIGSLRVQTFIREMDGTILINMLDPLNRKYFGDDPYKSVETNIHCQIRLADLVLDECLYEIVSKAWGKTLPRRFPDNPEVDIRLYVAEKKFEMGQLFHDQFVTLRQAEQYPEGTGNQEQPVDSGINRNQAKISGQLREQLQLPEMLNFTWVIADKLAGCAGPADDADLVFLKEKGITLIVRLVEANKAKVNSQQVEKVGLKDLHEPVIDQSAPSPEQIDGTVKLVKDALDKGWRVAVTCDAGIGRTGTMLSCILLSLGYTFAQAIDRVQKTRTQSKAWETDDQYQAICAYRDRMLAGSRASAS